MIFTLRGWFFLVASAAYGGAANAYFMTDPAAVLRGALLGFASTLVTILILANLADAEGRARLLRI